MKDNETLIADLQKELGELNEKIVKLVTFLHGKELPQGAYSLMLLKDQRDAMCKYADILEKRLRHAQCELEMEYQRDLMVAQDDAE